MGDRVQSANASNAVVGCLLSGKSSLLISEWTWSFGHVGFGSKTATHERLLLAVSSRSRLLISAAVSARLVVATWL